MIILVAIGCESIADPLYRQFTLLISQRDYIESARLRGTVAVKLKVLLCRAYDAALFGPGYCFCTATEAAVFTVANFHEYQALPVFHDQVYFAHTAIKIARNRL